MSRVGNTVGNVITRLESHDCLVKILLQDYDGELVNFNIEENEDGVLVIYPYVDDEE